MDKKIFKAEDLPEKDKVYLKKDGFGWRTVQPHKNEDGTWNILNLTIGGWRNFTFLIMVLLVLSFMLYAYNKDITTIQNHYSEISEDPTAFCRNLYIFDGSTRGVEKEPIETNFTGLSEGVDTG